MPARAKTIAELQRELKAKKRSLALLRQRRAKASARLNAIDKEIAALVGRGAPTRRAGKAPAKTAQRRRATGKPLLAYMREVLAKKPKGMRTKDIAAAVVKAGYKSYSKDFYAVVAKTLLQADGFKRLSRGVYGLAK